VIEGPRTLKSVPSKSIVWTLSLGSHSMMPMPARRLLVREVAKIS